MAKIKFSFIPTGSNNFYTDNSFEEYVDLDDMEESILDIFKSKYDNISNFESHTTYGDSCDRLVISIKFNICWNDYDGNERVSDEEWDAYVNQQKIRNLYQEIEEVHINAEYI